MQFANSSEQKNIELFFDPDLRIKFCLKPLIFFPITFFLSSQKHFNCIQQDQILYTQNRFFLVEHIAQLQP